MLLATLVITGPGLAVPSTTPQSIIKWIICLSLRRKLSRKQSHRPWRYIPILTWKFLGAVSIGFAALAAVETVPTVLLFAACLAFAIFLVAFLAAVFLVNVRIVNQP